MLDTPLTSSRSDKDPVSSFTLPESSDQQEVQEGRDARDNCSNVITETTEEFDLALQNIPDNEILPLLQIRRPFKRPAGDEARIQIAQLRALTIPARSVAQIRHALWWEWRERIQDRLEAFLELIPAEHHQSFRLQVSQFCSKQEPFSVFAS